jgi:hypothetical protein
LLASGVALLAPEETVCTAMLEGWQAQQRSRGLSVHTLEQRRLVLGRFLRFTDDYPWNWSAADVEEWTSELVGRGLAHSTVRNYQMAVALFCAYISDSRYKWGQVCERYFGTHPVQVFTAASTRAGQGTDR